jgi:hypothetical protein
MASLMRLKVTLILLVTERVLLLKVVVVVIILPIVIVGFEEISTICPGVAAVPMRRTRLLKGGISLLALIFLTKLGR